MFICILWSTVFRKNVVCINHCRSRRSTESSKDYQDREKSLLAIKYINVRKHHHSEPYHSTSMGQSAETVSIVGISQRADISPVIKFLPKEKYIDEDRVKDDDEPSYTSLHIYTQTREWTFARET
jgi:hypothetical protein